MLEEIPNLSSKIRKAAFAERFTFLHIQQFHLFLHLFEHVLFLLMVFVLAAQFEIVLVDAPVEQIVVKGDHTDIVDQMQFARSIEIDHRSKRTRMAIEEELPDGQIVIIT